MSEITGSDIERARAELPPYIRRTPLLRSEELSAALGHPIWLKCENLQITGSYKARAAFTLLHRLGEDARRHGVALTSSGNFATAFAYMGRRLGVPTVLVMMRKTSPFKAEQVARLGGEIVWCEDRFEARFETLRRLEAERGLIAINHLEDPTVVIGHGTIGLEILEQLPEVPTVLVPISTGGLIAGIALAVKERHPQASVIGVQPEGSKATYLSFKAGAIVSIPETRTICDALTATRPGTLMFSLIQRYVDDIVLVADEAVAEAVAWLAREEKLVVEPSGAVGIAALRSGQVTPHGPTVALLSGGNIAPAHLAEILTSKT
ncbi:L-threonine ammonia-lyase [bacterium HR08]|nr:L-threonine ammonia-lyase [bacterium HR08]